MIACKCFQALYLKLVLLKALAFLLLESHLTEFFSVSIILLIFDFCHVLLFLDELQTRFQISVLSIFHFFALENLCLSCSSSSESDDSHVGLSIYLFFDGFKSESFKVSLTSVFWNVKHPSDEGLWAGKLRVSKGFALDVFEPSLSLSSSPLILS